MSSFKSAERLARGLFEIASMITPEIACSRRSDSGARANPLSERLEQATPEMYDTKSSNQLIVSKTK